MNDIDPTDIDRLVDGELNDERLHDLLRACESDPSGWRDVALAFVESQVLSGGLRRLVAASVDEKPVIPPPIGPHGRPRIMVPLTLAVSMLLMLGVGYQVGKQSFVVAGTALDRATVPAAGLSSTPSLAPTPPLAPGRMASESVQMVMFDRQSDELRSVPVKLTHESQLPADYFEQSSQSTQQLQRWFQNAGHRLEHEQRFVPVKLPGNRMGIIPLDRYRVVRDQYQ